MIPEISPVVAVIASIVAVITGPLSVYYGYKRYKLAREKRVLEKKLENRFYDVRLLGTRDDVVNECSKMFLRARKGDTIFTCCQNCSGLITRWVPSMSRAVDSGASIKMIVVALPENEELIKSLRSLPNVDLRTRQSLPTIRISGITQSEVILSFKRPDGNFGLHFNDARTIELLWQIWNEWFESSNLIR